MPLVLPDDLSAKLQQAVADRDNADAMDVAHSDSVRSLNQATTAESAAATSLQQSLQIALNSAHDALDAVSTFLHTHVQAAVPPVPPPVAP